MTGRGRPHLPSANFPTAHDDATDPIRLTQYSHGAGRRKISPKVLEEIQPSRQSRTHAQLLVGNDLGTTPPCAISATVRR